MRVKQVIYENGEYITKMVKVPSKFRDGQVLSNVDMVKRVLNGSIVDKVVVGQYLGGDHDSDDVEKVRRLDVNEQIEVLEKNQLELQSKLESAHQKVDKLKEIKKLQEAKEAEKQAAIEKFLAQQETGKKGTV